MARIDVGCGKENSQRPLSVVQAFPHQRVTVEQPIGQRVVVLDPITECRLDSSARDSPVLEGDGVGSQDCETFQGQRGPEGLESVAHVTGDFALAEVELAVVLVKNDHATRRLAIQGCEQEGGDEVAFEALVLDPFSAVSVGFPRVASLKLDLDRVREGQSRSKHRSRIDRHWK